MGKKFLSRSVKTLVSQTTTDGDGDFAAGLQEVMMEETGQKVRALSDTVHLCKAIKGRVSRVTCSKQMFPVNDQLERNRNRDKFGNDLSKRLNAEHENAHSAVVPALERMEKKQEYHRSYKMEVTNKKRQHDKIKKTYANYDILAKQHSEDTVIGNEHQAGRDMEKKFLSRPVKTLVSQTTTDGDGDFAAGLQEGMMEETGQKVRAFLDTVHLGKAIKGRVSRVTCSKQMFPVNDQQEKNRNRDKFGNDLSKRLNAEHEAARKKIRDNKSKMEKK
ncbi:lens induction in camera-type eye [Branchiostoma belcheri]|nr:lens induction in camera-type eye [Branchiostoma belcheri]